MTNPTAIGFIAILLWSLLAVFTVGSAPVPPLMLNAMCFTIGGTLGVLWGWRSGNLSVLKTVPIKVYMFGTLGLFGYHALYFTALRLAPAAEAGLIAYLWPLLIVLLSGLLPNETLRLGHVLGGIIGFCGAGLLILDGSGFSGDATQGYLVALLCALTWAGYSVLSRRLGDIPTLSVAVSCIATAVLSTLGHLMFEQTVWPNTALSWASVVGLGIGPVGIAFYVWDIGVKRGNIQLLGVASYAAPILSTIVLICTGFAQATPILIVAALCIAGGAALAARASVPKV